MHTITRLMDQVTSRVDVPARILMSVMFLFSGVGKLTSVTGTQGYMEAHGVPGMLIWPAAAWELTAGALMLVGLQVRPLAFLLTGWCLLTASLFHTAFGDPDQVIHFLKNLTMAGAFLMLAKSGSPGASIDAVLLPRRQTSI